MEPVETVETVQTDWKYKEEKKYQLIITESLKAKDASASKNWKSYVYGGPTGDQMSWKEGSDVREW